MALPFASSSSSPSLMGDCLAPDSSINPSADWNVYPSTHSDSLFLGNDTQMLAGAHGLFTTAEDNMNILAVPTDMITNFCEPMTQEHSHSGSSYASTKDRVSSSPEQSCQSKSSSTKNNPLASEPSRVEKRKANTLAARRYRQKRVDQMSSLETELKDVKTERDEFKVRCARLEGEVETLRALLRAQK